MDASHDDKILFPGSEGQSLYILEKNIDREVLL